MNDTNTLPGSVLDTPWALPRTADATRLGDDAPRILLPDDEPGDYIEAVAWHWTSSPARPDAGIDVDLQTVEDGGTRVERGHWTGERWVYNESGGDAPEGAVRAWAYVEGPEL